MAPITRNNHHTVWPGTLHRPMRLLFGVLERDFSDPGPPPFFEDRLRSAFEDAAVPNESPQGYYAPQATL